MRTLQQRRGDSTELLVAAQLAASRWTILGRQVRVGRAELDIIAIDPGPPASLVVVEVRFRRNRDFGLPEETVDHRKLARLRIAAYNLRDAGRLPDGTPWPPLPLRLDIVVVEPGRELRHYRYVG
ncbi:MAG TPA: YraN family protein [Candidatus Limnocylindrales bacterium]|nr:YraN family protein [Candidatus Limnocylindrales bacterium]